MTSQCSGATIIDGESGRGVARPTGPAATSRAETKCVDESGHWPLIFSTNAAQRFGASANSVPRANGCVIGPPKTGPLTASQPDRVAIIAALTGVEVATIVTDASGFHEKVLNPQTVGRIPM